MDKPELNKLLETVIGQLPPNVGVLLMIGDPDTQVDWAANYDNDTVANVCASVLGNIDPQVKSGLNRIRQSN